MSISVRLPIRETAKVSSIKFPIREKALVLSGFVFRENIISWQKKETTLIESIKSRILLNATLLDKNHIKLMWHGEKVPKVMLYDVLDGDEFPNTPSATFNWSPQETVWQIDANGHDIKVKGTGDTGESNVISIGENREYEVECTVDLPINEKNFFIPIDFTSEFRIEVNF
jgi:hypothetical protein